MVHVQISHGADLIPISNELLPISHKNRSRGVTVNKALICALAIGGFAATAHAADLGGMKDSAPGPLSWQGVTLYGTIDVGAAYQNHGAPLSGASPNELEWNLLGSKNTGKTIATIAPNAAFTVEHRREDRGRHRRRLGGYR